MNSLETGPFDFIKGGRGVNERVRVLPIHVVVWARKGYRGHGLQDYGFIEEWKVGLHGYIITWLRRSMSHFGYEPNIEGLSGTVSVDAEAGGGSAAGARGRLAGGEGAEAK
jgi:hypothetical protein